MLVVHVVVLAPHITEGCVTHVTLVNSLRVRRSEVVSQRVRPAETLFADVAAVGRVLVSRPVFLSVSMEFLVLLQFQTLVEGLSTHLAHWTQFTAVLPHVIQQVFLFAKHIAAGVTLVLHPASVDGHMFLQAVQAGELASTDRAAEETAVVLLGIAGVLDLGYLVWKQKTGSR